MEPLDFDSIPVPPDPITYAGRPKHHIMYRLEWWAGNRAGFVRMGDPKDVKLSFEYNQKHDVVIVRDGARFLSRDEFEEWVGAMRRFYDVIEDIGGDLLERFEKRTVPFTPKKRSRRTPTRGYVYLMAGSNGLHKIGASINPQKRLKAIRRRYSPLSISILHTIKADDQFAAERRLHKRFEHCNSHGEWFELTNWEIARIKTLKRYANGSWVMLP